MQRPAEPVNNPALREALEPMRPICVLTHETAQKIWMLQRKVNKANFFQENLHSYRLESLHLENTMRTLSNMLEDAPTPDGADMGFGEQTLVEMFRKMSETLAGVQKQLGLE